MAQIYEGRHIKVGEWLVWAAEVNRIGEKGLHFVFSLVNSIILHVANQKPLESFYER